MTRRRKPSKRGKKGKKGSGKSISRKTRSTKKPKQSRIPAKPTQSEFRQASQTFESKKYGKFHLEIYQGIEKKTKAGKRLRYKKISLEAFKAGKSYHVYIVHNKTRFKRLLATGKLRELPARHRIPELFGRLLGGRIFKPLPRPKSAKGKWLPTHRIVKEFEKEMQAIAERSGEEVRAAIIPTTRYFHSGWKIFSNAPLNGNKRIHHLMVNAVALFEYPRQQWYGKQSFYVELDGWVKIRNLDKKYGDKLEQAANQWADLIYPDADSVRMIEINGYIPLPGKPRHKTEA